MRVRMSIVLGLAIGAALPAGAGAATWTPIEAGLPLSGYPAATVADGPRTLVASGDAQRVLVTTIGPRGGVALEPVARVVGRGAPQAIQLVSLPGGAVVLVWQDGTDTWSAVRTRPGRRFGPPRIVAPGALAIAPSLARAGDGALVAWWGGPSGGRLGIYAATIGGDGRWGPPLEISARTYPQQSFPRIPPAIGISATGSADGSAGVVWRQPAGAFGDSTRARIVVAERDAAGAWSPPVTLRDDIDLTASSLAAVTTSGGVTGAWSEARRARPDGVTAETCLMTGTTTAAGVDLRQVECRDGYDSGRTTLTGSGGGGVLVAWARGPDAPALRTSVTTYARLAGEDWSAGRTLVGEARGYSLVSNGVMLPRGGAVLGIRLGTGPRPGDRVRVIVIRDDGSVARRIRGPRSPAIRYSYDFRLDVLGPRRAVLLVGVGGFPGRYRASLLRLSAADLA